MALSLFADIVKSEMWVPETLKQKGGHEGVGVAFLQNAFSAAAASPLRRYHLVAAQSVLRSLLPENSPHVTGKTRSRRDLRKASGYGDNADAFDELLYILDGDLRLITPVALDDVVDGDHIEEAGEGYF